MAVLEMGISEFGEMDRLSTMANPDICVITNIGLCHLENLITRDGILKAKTESFAHLTPDGIAVLNGDDDKLCDKKVVNGKPAVFYGIEKAAKVAETEEGTKTLAEKTVYATNVEAVDLTGKKAAIHYPSKETGGEVTMEVTIPIAGEHNVYNALAAVSVARELGLTCDEMKRGIESVQTIGGRSNLIHKNGITIIDDCYNANPVSMKASLEVLQMYCPTHRAEKSRYSEIWASLAQRKNSFTIWLENILQEKELTHFTVWEHSRRRSLKQCVHAAARRKSIIMRTKQT